MPTHGRSNNKPPDVKYRLKIGNMSETTPLLAWPMLMVRIKNLAKKGDRVTAVSVSTGRTVYNIVW